MHLTQLVGVGATLRAQHAEEGVEQVRKAGVRLGDLASGAHEAGERAQSRMAPRKARLATWVAGKQVLPGRMKAL